MTHTVLNGLVVLRLAIGNIKTTEGHVMETWMLLKDIEDDLIVRNKPDSASEKRP